MVVWEIGQRRSRWVEIIEIAQALSFHYKRTLFGQSATA